MRYLLAMVMFFVACELTEIEKKPASVVEENPCMDEELCNLEDFDVAPFSSILVKLDCEQVGAFRKDDICVSNCTLCNSQEICIDTNGDKFFDTCVQGETPVTPPPTREPTPVVSTKKELCGGIEIELGTPCSGAFGACAENGVLECINGQMTCSTDVKGSESLATEEICGDNIDQNCNGVPDDGCVPKVDPGDEDFDDDGVEAKVDCDDTDPKIGVEFKECKQIKNSGKNELVFVIPDTFGSWYVTKVEYKEIINPAADWSAELSEKALSVPSVPNVIISLQGGSYLHFNLLTTFGYIIDQKTCELKTWKIPPVYEFANGKVINRSKQITIAAWFKDQECCFQIPLAASGQ